jgi:hypothetical protein
MSVRGDTSCIYVLGGSFILLGSWGWGNMGLCQEKFLYTKEVISDRKTKKRQTIQ